MFEIRADVEEAESSNDLIKIKKTIEAYIDGENKLLSGYLTSIDKEKISKIAVRLQYLYKVYNSYLLSPS